MNYKVQSIHFVADQKLIDYLGEKLQKLDHFYDHIVDGEVILKLNKASDHQNKVVEIKVHIPGKVLFVEEHNSTFESAADKAVEVISRQIKREKEKERGI